MPETGFKDGLRAEDSATDPCELLSVGLDVEEEDMASSIPTILAVKD